MLVVYGCRFSVCLLPKGLSVHLVFGGLSLVLIIIIHIDLLY